MLINTLILQTIVHKHKNFKKSYQVLNTQRHSLSRTGDMSPITSTTPLTVLPAGAIFYAGGFECHVVEAKPSDRGFSGTCYVVVPFYGFAKVLHTFDDIRINLDLQMYSGKLVSVTDTVKGNALMARIDDAMTAPGTGYNNDQVAQILGADTVIVLKDRIKTVVVNNEGKIVVTYNNGKEEVIEVEEGTKVVISDRDGEQYYVDNGTVLKAGDALAAKAEKPTIQNPAEVIISTSSDGAKKLKFIIDKIEYFDNDSYYTIYNNKKLEVKIEAADTFTKINLDKIKWKLAGNEIASKDKQPNLLVFNINAKNLPKYGNDLFIILPEIKTTG